VKIPHAFKPAPAPHSHRCVRCDGPRRMHKSRKPRYVVGIDGEGQGRSPHRYTFIAASDSDGRSWQRANLQGLSSVECLDFILALPARARVFGFAFRGYDLTKIFQDLPDELIFKLFREQQREREIDGQLVTIPVQWEGYEINLMNRKLTVKRGNRRTTVWDIFGFFGKKFTGALSDWKVGTVDEIAEIERMKDKRSEFDNQSFAEVKTYCLSECRKLATLGERLVQAHKEADLELRSFHGAGSTASVILKRLGISNKRGVFPSEMRKPLACAFFGGRPENSVIGKVEGRIWGYDVSSAYPYHISQLPCLECGSWRRVMNPSWRDIDGATLALSHWHSKAFNTGAWGLLPVRSEDGTIAFPYGGKGGWAWKPEITRAHAMNPRLKVSEAWLYHTDCDHRPFNDIPALYLERIKLGKDGPGLVIKLGLNSCYGKLAQSKGIEPPFQSWIWAGNITSGTRGQLLDAIRIGGDAVLMVATDGVWSRTRLDLPLPIDTGTSHVPKPLGGWEEKSFDNGVFCARPGVYFPLNPTDEQLAEVRGRGLGKKVVYGYWRDIVDAYDRGDPAVVLTSISRFVGAKTGVSFGPKSGYKRSENYGEWIDHTIKLSFDPRPKRRSVNSDRTLEVWPYLDWESEPYDSAVKSTALETDLENRDILDEQPDIDLVSQ